MCLYVPLLLQVALVIHYHLTIWRKVINISFCVCILTSYIKFPIHFDPRPSTPFKCSHTKTRIVASITLLCLRLWDGSRVCVIRQSRCAHQNGRIDGADTSIYYQKEEHTWMGFERGKIPAWGEECWGSCTCYNLALCGSREPLLTKMIPLFEVNFLMF